MVSSRFSALALRSAALVVGCDDDGDGADSGGGGTGAATGGAGGTGGTGGTGGMVGTGGMGTGGMAPFDVTSTTFAEGETIPTNVECGPPIANGPGKSEIAAAIESTSIAQTLLSGES